MEKNLLILTRTLIVGGVFFGLFGLINFAQAALGISPLIFELSGEQGEIIENYLKVYNPDSVNIVGVKIDIENITPTGEIGGVLPEVGETESYSLASWIKAEPAEFTLNPSEEKFVKFTISVPDNAEPGGHYGTLLAGVKAVAGPEMTGAAVVHRVGCLVLLTVPGEAREELVIKDFSASRSYFEYGPVPFVIRFENKGTIHLKPAGFITVTDWLGRKVADISFPQKNVLPKGTRRIEATLDQKWLWAGKYTATLSGSYGTSNTPIGPVVISFWAFPWKFGLIILGVLFLLALIRRRLGLAFRVLIKGE